MSAEIYYALKEGAVPVTFDAAQQSFITAGLACTVEPEGPEMYWLVFDQSKTTILASTKGEHFVFATVHAPFAEDPHFIELIDCVFQSMGFSADETEEF